MTSRRTPKTYKPVELQQAQKVLQQVGFGDPNRILTALHQRGFRVVYVGHIGEGAPLTRHADCHTKPR